MGSISMTSVVVFRRIPTATLLIKTQEHAYHATQGFRFKDVIALWHPLGASWLDAMNFQMVFVLNAQTATTLTGKEFASKSPTHAETSTQPPLFAGAATMDINSMYKVNALKASLQLNLAAILLSIIFVLNVLKVTI